MRVRSGPPSKPAGFAQPLSDTAGVSPRSLAAILVQSKRRVTGAQSLVRADVRRELACDKSFHGAERFVNVPKDPSYLVVAIKFRVCLRRLRTDRLRDNQIGGVRCAVHGPISRG